MRSEKVHTKRRLIVSQPAHSFRGSSHGGAVIQAEQEKSRDFVPISMRPREILTGCDRLDRGVKLRTFRPVSGSSSAVERQLPKLDVAGSIPVSRSINSIA